MSELSTQIQVLNDRYSERVVSILKSANTTRHMIQSFMDDLFIDVIEKSASYTPFNDLYNGLGKGIDKKSIKQWVHHFTPLRWNEEKGAFIRSKKHKWDRPLLAEGKRNPYFEWDKPKAERTEKPFDPAKKYKTLENRVRELLKEFHDAGADDTKLNAILQALSM